ncbi:MAG: hypothetical protein KDB18_09765 [Salinibacterium sp.]|nr:hypothetical protein [Salinibacterium sp.]
MQQPDGRELEIIIAKQHDGPTGTVQMQFARVILKFQSKAHTY